MRYWFDTTTGTEGLTGKTDLNNSCAHNSTIDGISWTPWYKQPNSFILYSCNIPLLFPTEHATRLRQIFSDQTKKFISIVAKHTLTDLQITEIMTEARRKDREDQGDTADKDSHYIWAIREALKYLSYTYPDKST